MFMLLAAAALAVPPTADVAGSCPGALTITIDGLTPGGNFVVIASDDVGGHVLPGGPCAGVATGLAPGVVFAGPFSDFDGDGAMVFSPTVGGGACDKLFTVVDLDSCTTSPVTALGGSPGGPCTDLVGGVNTGDSFNDGVSAGGIPVGMKYVAPAAMSVGRIEIFTGERSGENSIALWSHNAVGDEPGVELASGTWMMSAENGWQGADLDASVILGAGETYWIVWEPISGAQWTQDLSGDSVTYKATDDGYASWFGPFSQPYKHKLFACE